MAVEVPEWKNSSLEAEEARRRATVDQAISKSEADSNASERAALLDPKGRLFHACEIGDSDRVFLILKKAEESDQSIFSEESVGALVEATTPDGVTPLFTACKAGHVECAKLLVEAGARPNRPTKERQFTPLWIACQKGRERCVRLLLTNARGVNVNQKASDGRTPLYAACEGGNAACVQLCIEAGAKLELRRHDGSTPLIVAAVFGHAEVVELLLAAGAKLRPKDEDGTALDNARRGNGGKREETIMMLEAAVAERFKEEFDPDAPYIDEDEPLTIS